MRDLHIYHVYRSDYLLSRQTVLDTYESMRVKLNLCLGSTCGQVDYKEEET